jgi:hypothetical protein
MSSGWEWIPVLNCSTTGTAEAVAGGAALRTGTAAAVGTRAAHATTSIARVPL